MQSYSFSVNKFHLPPKTTSQKFVGWKLNHALILRHLHRIGFFRSLFWVCGHGWSTTNHFLSLTLLEPWDCIRFFTKPRSRSLLFGNGPSYCICRRVCLNMSTPRRSLCVFICMTLCVYTACLNFLLILIVLVLIRYY